MAHGSYTDRFYGCGYEYGNSYGEYSNYGRTTPT